LNPKEIETAIQNLDFRAEPPKRLEIVEAIKAAGGQERSRLTALLEKRYLEQLRYLLDEGPIQPAFRFLEPGVAIELTLTEPKLKYSRTFTLQKSGGKAHIEPGKPDHPVARWSMTLGAVDHVSQADDYVEAGANLLRCRRYPTEDRTLTWETTVPAIEVYETGLLHFLRKLGMF